MGAHAGLRHWARDQKLLARTEYLAAENRILKAQLKGRLKLSNAERATLGEIGHRLGRKVLGEVANMARQTPSWPAARRGYAGREQFPLLLQFFDPTPSDC